MAVIVSKTGITRVACLDLKTIYGIGEGKQVYFYNEKNGWDLLEDKEETTEASTNAIVKDIVSISARTVPYPYSTNTPVVVAVSEAGEVFFYDKGKWVSIPTSGYHFSYAAGVIVYPRSLHIYCLTNDNRIARFDTQEKKWDFPLQLASDIFTGRPVQFSIDQYGSLWILLENNEIFHAFLDLLSDNWHVFGIGKAEPQLSQISCGDGNLKFWAIDNQGNLYKANSSKRILNMQLVDFTRYYKHISAGVDGTVTGIDKNNEVTYRFFPGKDAYLLEPLLVKGVFPVRIDIGTADLDKKELTGEIIVKNLSIVGELITGLVINIETDDHALPYDVEIYDEEKGDYSKDTVPLKITGDLDCEQSQTIPVKYRITAAHNPTPGEFTFTFNIFPDFDLIVKIPKWDAFPLCAEAVTVSQSPETDL